MDRRTFAATAGATLASVGLAGCSAINDNDNSGNSGDGNQTNGSGESDAADELDWEEIEAEIGQTPDNVELSESRLVETQEGAAVIGTIRNTGQNPYSVLEVEVTLNDGDTIIGEWVDTTEEEINNLGSGETWRFEAAFDDENVYDVTGYTITIDGDIEDLEGDGAGNNTS
ncbi:FxLYD domain-containing protein [Natrinema sp. DC36]|uniref:FxLYD domain-containing protein n=1 Tax=Natrinema sp. DC36 TaxID=2878680 RepID=UPI001CF04A8E|nr:FxLYD domain-containing protein [Natrinema sp. DC36]